MNDHETLRLPTCVKGDSRSHRITRGGLALCCTVLFWCFLTPGAALGSERQVTRAAPLDVDETYALQDQRLANLNTAAYRDLRSFQQVRIMRFPLADDSSVDLELEQVYVTTPATRIVMGTTDGDKALPFPEIAVFRGRVADSPGSDVLMTLTRSELRAVIRTEKDTYFVSPIRGKDMQDGPRLHSIHDSSVAVLLTPVDAVPHGTDDCLLEDVGSGHRSASPDPTSTAVTFRAGRVALDVDSAYYANFSDVDSALASIYHLFASISQPYETDLSVKITLTYIRIWTNPATDPYSATGGGAVGLHEFQNYWIANHSTPGTAGYVDRDSAHLLSGRPVGSAGNVSQLCLSFGYSISGGSGNPDGFLHDLYHAAHELGHVYGGNHTHCLTDPATNGWIDECATQTGCNDTQSCDILPGTIMSYCHNCGGYGDAQLTLEFHAVNIANMRTIVDGACLRAVRNPCYVDGSNNSGPWDGTSSNPYSTIQECVEAVSPGGTVVIANGNYPEELPIIGRLPMWQPMTLTAPGGNVVIGQ